MRLDAEAAGGLAWLAVGLFAAWQGRELGIGTLAEPGSGFLIFWAGCLIAGFALAIAAAALRSRAAQEPLWAGTRWDRVLVVTAALVIYAALLDRIGYLAATAALMLALMRLVLPVRWPVALGVALGSTAGTWWVMQRLLGIQLPRAAFEIG